MPLFHQHQKRTEKLPKNLNETGKILKTRWKRYSTDDVNLSQVKLFGKYKKKYQQVEAKNNRAKLGK